MKPVAIDAGIFEVALFADVQEDKIPEPIYKPNPAFTVVVMNSLLGVKGSIRFFSKLCNQRALLLLEKGSFLRKPL